MKTTQVTENVEQSVNHTIEIIEKTLGVSATHAESDRGLFIERGLYVIRQGSAYVMISLVQPSPGHTRPLVRLVARVAAGVTADALLFQKLLTLNMHVRFGAFAYDIQEQTVLLVHTLLGGEFFNSQILLTAAHDVATMADIYDDEIVAAYGGSRMQDVVQASALAHLMNDLE